MTTNNNLGWIFWFGILFAMSSAALHLYTKCNSDNIIWYWDMILLLLLKYSIIDGQKTKQITFIQSFYIISSSVLPITITYEVWLSNFVDTLHECNFILAPE